MNSLFWECISNSKRIFDELLEPLEKEYQLKKIELEILLFIYNNPSLNTQKDMVLKRGFAKSHVSTSVKNLLDYQLIDLYYKDGNKKTVYIRLLDLSKPIIDSLLEVEKQCIYILFGGVTEEQFETIKAILEIQKSNIERYKGN